MIELTLLDFHGQQYSEQQFCLYVVKNPTEDALSVGISVNDGSVGLAGADICFGMEMSFTVNLPLGSRLKIIYPIH